MTTDPSKLPLRDIHLPDPISWWPPAAGWWILAALTLLILAGTALFLTNRRKTLLKRTALAELTRIRDQYLQQQDDGLTVRELSRLLRRVCISFDRRAQVASLTGADWLQHLDKFGGDKLFTSGVGRRLAEAPYQQHPEHCAAELLEICQRWLTNLPSSNRRY